jgi:ATP-binding cassette subfamily B protein/subfamily B ATP-binding cassette protein MsbA
VTKDSECISTIVESALLPAAAATVTIVSMVLIMWRLDPALTGMAFIAVPLLALTLRRYGGPIADRSYVEQEVESGIYEIVEQTLSAIPAVQAFGREADADERLRRQCDDSVDAAVSASNAQLLFSVVAGLATALATAGIFWVGGRQALAGHLSIGTILVFTSYLSSLYAPLDAVMHASSTIHGAAGSADRVLEVLEAEPEVADAPGAKALGAVRGEVRFEAVTFGYEAGRPVLEEVSLEARPGETVAIVGPTGAGKTTLVSLILRFFDPWSGRVTVDGADLRGVQLSSLRSQVGLVLQEPFLFPLSVADNLAYGRPGAARSEIEEAARAANAHEFICRLPEGYDTVIGERGGTLSGGERQRVAIARALLRNAPILILDEPTSALDASSEHLLLEALERLMAGRTTFIIAHRLSTIRGADRIAVLEGGRIVEAGSHAQLLERAGLYARLHHLQHGPVAEAVGP